ncbi:MAG: hypothetical protein ABSC54_08045 [Smithellaceae bacterium]
MDKMKQVFLKTIILTGLLFTLSYNISLANDWNVRPVKLKVVDAVTKEPLSGIKVYYVLTTRRPEMGCLYIFYPSFIHQPSGVERNVAQGEDITDKNGEVLFPAKTLNLQCYESVFEEKIAVNLDFTLNEAWKKELFKDRYGYFEIWGFYRGDKELSNIERRFKGFFLTYDYKDSRHEERIVKSKDYREKYEKHTLKKLDALNRATVWDGPPEEYTVELRRADN